MAGVGAGGISREVLNDSIQTPFNANTYGDFLRFERAGIIRSSELIRPLLYPEQRQGLHPREPRRNGRQIISRPAFEQRLRSLLLGVSADRRHS